MGKFKLNISVDDELLRRVDDYADEHYMNRSAVFSLAATQLLNSERAVKAVFDIALSMRKIADSGCISDEDKQKLSEFETFAKVLTGK
jgi:metal-responsive CopG/Arc/MetJ family transcriptional regulator